MTNTLQSLAFFLLGSFTKDEILPYVELYAAHSSRHLRLKCFLGSSFLGTSLYSSLKVEEHVSYPHNHYQRFRIHVAW
jgi:hypothetical protein